MMKIRNVHSTEGITRFETAPLIQASRRRFLSQTLTTAMIGPMVALQATLIRTDAAILQKSANSISPQQFGAFGDGIADDTLAIQAAIEVNRVVFFPNGTYAISDKLVLRTNQVIHFAPGVKIVQKTENCQIFFANSVQNLTLDFAGGRLAGEGSYYGGGDHYLIYNRHNAPRWTASTRYAVGEFCHNGNNQVYRCTATGISSRRRKPTGFGATNKDGSVFWEHVGTRIYDTPVFWTGNSGRNDRAIDFHRCSNIKIIDPVIENCGHSGIALFDCTDVKIQNSKISGTHRISTPIINDAPYYWANFQIGIYLHHSPAGNCENVTIERPEISNVAHGILNESANDDQPDRGITVSEPYIHDIEGQHAFYLQSGNLVISNPRLENINLSGIKIQSTIDNNSIDISNIVVNGVNGRSIASNFVEIAVISGKGSISDVTMQGAVNDTGVGIAIVGKVSAVRADLVIKNATAHGIVIQGASPIRDLDLSIILDGSGQHGIVCTAPNTKNIRIKPTLRNTGYSVPHQSAIISAANGSRLEIYDPVISGLPADYALHASTAGAKIIIHGVVNITAGRRGLSKAEMGAVVENVGSPSF
ncbi:glycosyl hydrolase family 28-related protein [Parasphingorhabdus halotolerans]|uniref:Rhamnogalacturonase A/B/Epimerase-like pectate lyase domain-containing protein n=1 Tax=Parasphingorhabdus halotolerans TaxID=2725558 RepID=A0A6H2DPP8_9SPHN|nr:glycosyl hydrolase family 28-related protein [Parasphingorhabdus halotolerans]QJB69731.1 hypothetical protein HF685_10960 [Parasphingorhabdus halotolerans]